MVDIDPRLVALPGFEDVPEETTLPHEFSRTYDRLGNPITFEQWACAKATKAGIDDYCRVAQDTIGPYWVSTVWMGIDQGFGNGPPIIFETMVFAVEFFSGIDTRRYSTEEEAIAGHREVVEQVQLLVAANPDWKPERGD